MVDELDKIYPQFLGDWVKEGFADKLVIIGFPYDLGARQAGQRQGADHGPDSFRRFLKMNNIGSMENPELDISIGEHLKVCDYGNIQIDGDAPNHKALMDKLATKVGLCLSRGNIPFIIGGSRDLLQAVC
jgi:arginase family enzyme